MNIVIIQTFKEQFNIDFLLFIVNIVYYYFFKLFYLLKIGVLNVQRCKLSINDDGESYQKLLNYYFFRNLIYS